MSNFLVFYCFVISLSKKLGTNFFFQINQLLKQFLYQIYLEVLHLFLTFLQKFGGKTLKKLFIFFLDFYYFKVYFFFINFKFFLEGNRFFLFCLYFFSLFPCLILSLKFIFHFRFHAKNFYIEFKDSKNIFQSLKNKTKQIDFTNKKDIAKVWKFCFELSYFFFLFTKLNNFNKRLFVNPKRTTYTKILKI